MDNDDVLIETALEELYNFAENFQVDVVYCEKYFTSAELGEDFKKNIKIVADTAAVSEENNLMSNNIIDRTNIWLQRKFGVMPWRCLSTRNFLINAEIKFRELKREDVFWSFEVLFSAPKILRVTKPLYIHRLDKNSMTARNNTLSKYIAYWMDRTVNGLGMLEDFMMKIPFFAKNPAIKFTLLNHWAMGDLDLISRVCGNFEPYILKENFQKVFAKNLGDKDTLIAYLFANSIRLINESKNKMD